MTETAVANPHTGSTLDSFLIQEGIPMLDVITVKWGTKYGPEYVNRLKSMMTKHCTRPFKMWCYTDEKYGIDYDIEIIDIPEEDDLEGWWNKVGVFKESMPYTGRCLYLDLDTVIQNNIDDLVDYEPHELCGVWTYWNQVWTDGDYKYATLRHKVPFNSSVMTWNKNQCTWIWDHFWKDHHEYIMKYYGDDKYLGNETEYSTFPQEWIYSRLYGDGIHKPTDKARFDNGAQMVHYRPDAKICLMNGPTSDPHYERFEEHWT